MFTVLFKSMLLRMRLAMDVRRVLRCVRLAVDCVGGFVLCLRVHFKCFDVKFYVSEFVALVTKVMYRHIINLL